VYGRPRNSPAAECQRSNWNTASRGRWKTYGHWIAVLRGIDEVRFTTTFDAARSSDSLRNRSSSPRNPRSTVTSIERWHSQQANFAAGPYTDVPLRTRR